MKTIFPLEILRGVQAAAMRSPFYRMHLPDVEIDEENWQTLPFTTKTDLRRSYPCGLLSVPIRDVATYHESSGTSGDPISSYFTERDWADIYGRFLRSRVGLTAADMVFVKTPYSLVTTGHQMHGAARSVGACVVPGDNRSLNMPYARVLRLLRDLPISVVWCLPTEAHLWAYLLRQSGLDPAKDFPHLRAFLVAGEALSQAKSKEISRIWGGKDVIQDYGSTETGSLAGECRCGQLHLWSDRLHFEVRHDNSRLTTATGCGSLVVTPLFREAMPLVRYDLEDQVKVSESKCQCGEFTIEVLGRKNGDGIYPKDLEEVVFSFGNQVWFWRARVAGEVIEVEIASEGRHFEKLRREIETRFARRAIVRPVEAAAFASPEWLVSEARMQKPRYLYSGTDDWSNSVRYY